MKIYNVEIEARHGGSVLRFTEVVKYYDNYCVPEEIRERKAIDQVRERMPHLTDVRALSSISP